MRTWARAVAVVGIFLALAYTGAYLLLRGERLGRAVTDGAWPLAGVNPTIRGRLVIESIDWAPLAPLDWLLGRPVRGRGVGVRVFDPRGQLCLTVPEISVSLRLSPLIFRGDFEIESAHAPRATVVLLATPIAAPAAGPSAPPAAPETEIGLLAAFAPRVVAPRERGPRFDIRDVTIDHVDFDLQEPSWRLHLPDASLGAGLHHAGGVPAVDGMPFFLRNRSPIDARLSVLGWDFDLKGARFERFEATASHPRDLAIALRAQTAEGAALSLQGALTSIFSEAPGLNARLGLRHAGPLLGRLAALPIGGDVGVDATFSGPLREPEIDLDARDARLSVGSVAIDDVHANVRFKGPIVEVRDAGASVFDGRATAHGRLDLSRGVYEADLALERIDTTTLMPALAGRLSGSVRLRGPLSGRSAKADIDATLMLDRRGPLPRRIRATGSLSLEERTLRTEDFLVSTSGASAHLRGSADLDGKRLDLRGTLSAEDPSRLVPALAGARGLSISVAVHGPARRPTASGGLSLRSYVIGPLVVAGLSSPFDLDLDSVALPHLRATAMGGAIRAQASLAHLQDAPTLRVKGDAQGLDLAALTHGSVEGKLSGGFNLAGPLRNLAGRVSLRSERLDVGGTMLEDLEAVARLDGGAIVLDELRARSGTATLRAGGRIGADGTLAASLDLAGLSLERSQPIPMGGTVTGHLDVAGTLADPQLAGRVELSGFRLRDVNLGDGRLTLQPSEPEGEAKGASQSVGKGRTRIEGGFFFDRLRIEGTIAPRPLTLDAVVQIAGFDLTGPLPEMRELGFVSAPATGRIALRWDVEHGLTEGAFSLQRFQVTHRDDKGAVIVVENRRPVEVRYQSGRATLSRAELVSAAGNFAMEGWIERNDSDLRLRGAVKLDLLQVFWSQIIALAQGEARANLWLRGPLDHPTVVGSLELFGATLVPRDLEMVLRVPQGRLVFNTDQLALENLVIESGTERATFDGHVMLSQLRPTMLDVAAKGTLAADLLLVLLREQISTASGDFAISLRALGPWEGPTLTGEIRPKQVEIVPRRLGRVLTLSGGAIRLDGNRVRFDALSGTVDEGSVKLDGLVRLDGLRPDFVDLHLIGENFPHRVPNQYEAELNLDLRLSGSVDALVLDGQVDLVDARYTRDFQVTRLVLRPKVVEEQPPVWRGIPEIERMTLALHVASRGSVGIRNNVADIDLGVSLDVGGTPDEPTLEGEVRAEQGKFHLPLLKGEYSIDGGGAAFVSGQPVESARVRIEGTSIVPDRTETEHEVRLLLAGTLNEMQLSLSSPGLDPGQVLSLVATGRTTEQLRQELRGDQPGSGAAASPGAAAADQSIKELTSDLFNVVVDPVGRIAHADTTRFEVGSESVTLLLCWRLLGKRIEACGEGDTYLAGGQRQEGRLELRIDERLTAEANAEHLPPEQNAFESDLTRMRLQLRYKQRIRF